MFFLLNEKYDLMLHISNQPLINQIIGLFL